MPLVRFYETVPAKSGTIPAKGTISFVPTSPYFKTTSEHVLPEPFSVDLVSGAAEVYLDPTLGWAWKVIFYLAGYARGTVQEYYVSVPDSDGPLNWADLEHVDKRSLKAVNPDPIWKVEINRLHSKIKELQDSPTTNPDNPDGPVDGVDLEFIEVEPGIYTLGSSLNGSS